MRLSRKDVFFLSLRLTIIVYLFLSMGIFFGVFLILAYNLSNTLLMNWLFGLEAVAPVDTLMVHDDDKNIANIICKERLI
jgi:hypothetical protein